MIRQLVPHFYSGDDMVTKQPNWVGKVKEFVVGQFTNYFDGSTATEVMEMDVEQFLKRLDGDTKVIYFFRTNFPAEMPGRKPRNFSKGYELLCD
eukprot:TRINITY_DN8578_c0_g1_i1.p1 TRINITY_DN8578_c0_g1~~TRINITY_DN8578_c0_g1_i1.p1  ORF type:complete len:94 (+),score=9.45 TRINITY_DN8578_c0_g1_i1:94-375(+)